MSKMEGQGLCIESWRSRAPLKAFSELDPVAGGYVEDRLTIVGGDVVVQISGVTRSGFHS